MASDREFIDRAAKGLKIEAEPFKPLADDLGMTVDEVIGALKRLIDEGKVRRFAASVRHQPMGYSVNAMVIARCEEGRADEVGRAAADVEGVSHCYLRDHPDGDPWCVYVMIHGQERDAVKTAVEKIKGLSGARVVEVCRSLGELKKTSLSGVTTDLDQE